MPIAESKTAAAREPVDATGSKPVSSTAPLVQRCEEETHSSATREADLDRDSTLRLESRLPPLLSIIAGMVDVTSFFMLGRIFTAHITGNLAVVAAVSAQGQPPGLVQTLTIPVFIVAVASAWLLAHASDLRGAALARLLLIIQFWLLAILFVLCVATKASANPHSLAAGIGVMIAVSAMACQFVVFRLAMPDAISTAESPKTVETMRMSSSSR